MISSISQTTSLFSLSFFFWGESISFFFQEKQEKTSLLRGRKTHNKTNPSQQARKKSEKGSIMFSSLSMRSALVGTSVPTTSTNSRGTRVHRSRRAQSARIPGTFFASFFCSFPLSSVVAFSRRRRFGSTVSKETARYITQRAHEVWIKRVIISYGYFSIFAWRCVHFECSRVRCRAHLRQLENLKRNLGKEDEKEEEEERFIHFFLKFLSPKPICFNYSLFFFFFFKQQLNKSKRSWPRSLAWRQKRRKDSSAIEKSVPDSLELPIGRELACTEATHTSLCKSSTTTRKRL